MQRLDAIAKRCDHLRGQDVRNMNVALDAQIAEQLVDASKPMPGPVEVTLDVQPRAQAPPVFAMVHLQSARRACGVHGPVR